ncbi:MAG: helix-turn-helix domain-containing protein, partial [Candidatus Adiutrix sp.]
MENNLSIKALKLSAAEQFLLRKQIVSLRKKGKTIAEIVELLGVQTRHAQSVWKKYKDNGLASIAPQKRGRPKG